jgi:hypothetical protein
MPELRLVVLALQDRLAYGPTFRDALAGLFGGQPSSLTSTAQAQGPSSMQAAQPTASAAVSPGRSALIAAAAQDLADYQSLTAQGKLAEAGQKLQDLKSKLNQLQTTGK